MEVDYSNWLTKKQAAQVTGLSTKTIQILSKKGKLQTHLWPRPGGPLTMLYHPDDVERVRNERKDPREPAFVVPPEPKRVERSPAKANGTSQGSLNAILEAFQEAYTRPRVTEMIFLSLDDASALSQLPRRHLRRLIATGKLDGLKTGLGWRVRRVDLDKL
jgi:excisionase family DNA binding protein